jgi:hypothetical protein
MTISRRLLAVVTALPIVVGATGSWGMLLFQERRDFDVVASAYPDAPGASEQDRAAMFEHARGKRVRADAVATSSASCDSCHGTATAVQVISINKARQATADNTATAWSSCDTCGATSVSVQIVLARSSTTLTLRNRALAVNASCTSCDTSAVAIQLVVVGAKHQTLSPEARAQLQSLARQLGTQLPTPAHTKAARTASAAAAKEAPGLSQIKTLVQNELQPTAVRPNVDVKSG